MKTLIVVSFCLSVAIAGKQDLKCWIKGKGSQTYWSATEKAAFVLPCDPQVVIFGVSVHFEWCKIFLLAKFDDSKKGHDP